jgi:endonuclease YncB( thermonuclease family)
MAVATAILAGLGLWAWRGLSELPAGTATETIAAGLEAARISAEAPPAPAREPGSEPPPADPGAVETGDDIRYVEGAGIVATRIDGPLTRAPSAVVVPEAAAPDGPKPTLYRLVVIEDADTVNLRSHTVQLANVAGPAADEMCTNASGAVWPCGMRARTALRRLVRSRALECLDLPSPEGAPARATCSAAGEDLSTWLVEHGWARPTNDAPDDLKALHAAAEAEGRGLFNPAGR